MSEPDNSGKSMIGPMSVGFNREFYPRPAEESESDSFVTDEESGSTKTTTPIPMESSSSESKDNKMLDTPSKVAFVEQGEDIKDDEDGQKMNAATCGVCFQILLDPISLRCGHSFCELCLAGMWKANRHQPVPLCPMCREPWGREGDRLPSVNVMLRDIIGQQYPEKIKERRESILQEETDLLKSFDQARIIGTRPPTQVNRRVGINIPVTRAFICMLASVFIVAMVLAMVVVSSLLWLLDAHDEYMFKNVREWDQDDVQQWMKGLGESVRKDCMKVFEREKIDGVHLLSLTDESLSKGLGIEDPYIRQSLLLSVHELSEKEVMEPRNFKEFKAVNREELMLITFLYNFNPRLTFLYLYLFKYKNMFLPLVRAQLNIRSKLEDEEEDDAEGNEDPLQEWSEQDDVMSIEEEVGVADDEGGETKERESLSQSEESWVPSKRHLIALAIEAVLVPHVVVMAFVYAHFSKKSVLFYALMFHCGMSTFVELKLLRNRLRNPRGREQYSISQIFRSLRNNVVGYLMVFIVGSVIYMILPIVILDLLFYGMLFRPLLLIAYGVLVKPCLSRTIRFIVVQLNQRLAHRGVV